MNSFTKYISALALSTGLGTAVQWQTSGLTSLKPNIADKVAAILPLTGGLKSNGEQMKIGIEAAVKVLWEEGIRVKVTFYDDKSSRDGALAGVEQARSEGTLMFQGCFGGVSCSIIAEKWAPLPLMGALTWDPKLRLAPHVTMTRIDARGELDLIFKHAATSGRPLTIYIQDDGFGQSYAQYLDELSKKYTFPLGEKILFKPASLAEKPEASRYADLTRWIKITNNALIIAGMPHAIGITRAIDNSWKNTIRTVYNLAGQGSDFYFTQTQWGSSMRSAVQVIPSPSSSISPYAKGFREQTKDSGSLIAYEAYSGVIAMAHRMHPTKIKLAGLLREDGTFQPGISVMNTAGVRSK